MTENMEMQVEIKIELDKLRKCKIMVATPMYGGMAAGVYTKSTNDLCMYATHHGVQVGFYYLFNESLITRARNYCVDEFLRSDCTHLMFIDADIGFQAQDVFVLLQLMINDPDNIDVITGPYPKKSISWEKIKRAVERGYADKNPFELENFVGDYVFNPVKGMSSFRIDEPVEVLEAGTGFMLIPRATFEAYEKAYPEYHYLPDHIRTEAFDGSREIMAYFDCIIDPESKRYLSEDYMFCQNLIKIKKRIWMCPWMELKHVGSYLFGGSLSALAAIQASPTASLSSNKKFYEQKANDPSTIPNLDFGLKPKEITQEDLDQDREDVFAQAFIKEDYANLAKEQRQRDINKQQANRADRRRQQREARKANKRKG